MLELKGITKKFGDRVVLSDVHLKLRREETVFVLGKSGVGKSVLLKIIVGLLCQDSGEVWVNGEKTVPESEERMVHFRRQCGLVFQMPALLDSLTIEENLVFGLDSDQKQNVRGNLDLVQLSHSILKKYPAQLSFGTQKKVSVLRTLLRRPQFILFDEPTTGLDPVSTEITNQMIQKVVRETKTGCLVVSHDVKSAQELSDSIYLLDEGKVIFRGKKDEFQKSQLPLVKAFLQGASVHVS